MRQGINSKKGKGQKKSDGIISAGLTAYLIGLVFRIPLGYLIGDRGVGYFSAGLELFVLITCITSFGMTKSVAMLMKYRVKRELFKSARKVYRAGLLFSGGLSLILAAAILVFSEWMGKNIFSESLVYLSFAAITPGILLISVVGVMRGYFQGMGSIIPSLHSRLLEKLIMAMSSLVIGYILFGYGKKVSGLLQKSAYSYAYGGFGAALGISVACLLCLIHLLLIYTAYSGIRRKQLLKESGKAGESYFQIVGLMIATALPYIALALLFNAGPLVDMGLFYYVMNQKGQKANAVMQWGVYYGKYMAIAGGIAVLCTLSASGGVTRILRAFEKKDMGGAQVELGFAVHHLVILSIPCAIILAVTAPSLSGLLFGEDTKLVAGLLQAGAPIVVLFPMTYMLAAVLLRIRKISVVLTGGIVGFSLHICLLLVLLYNTRLQVTAVVLGAMLFYLVVLVICHIALSRQLQYAQEWLRTFGVTGIAAGVTGLIGLILHKALLTFAGNLLTFLISLIVCVVLYNFLLLILKGVSSEELKKMPGGELLIVIGEKLRFL